MDQPPLTKRTLRPTASLPTTAEHYGEKHGIDPELTLALQNIGRRGRQSIAQPTFARTSTAPVISFNSPNPLLARAPGFQTSHEIMQQAQGIVNLDAWRSSTRELRPYGSTASDEPSFTGRRASEGEESRTTGVGVRFQQQQQRQQQERGMKRTQEEEEEEEEGTEVDEDEYQDPSSIDLDDTQQGGVGGGGDEFPPVFKSPNLTQPELFHRPRPMPTRFAVPQLPDRATKGLPARRGLGKTVSAPVGRLGFGGGGMDVDEGQGEGEDGFDVSEWAGNEDF